MELFGDDRIFICAVGQRNIQQHGKSDAQAGANPG
jgi:hypothetical protein